MPVVRSSIAYPDRKSRRLQHSDPTDCTAEEQIQSSNSSPPQHIPRPRNAFFCFRSEFVHKQKAASLQPKSLAQTRMSCSAADVWRGMSVEERRPYTEQAQREKEDHARMYPHYRYTPGTSAGLSRRMKKNLAEAARQASLRSSPASSSPTSDDESAYYRTSTAASLGTRAQGASVSDSLSPSHLLDAACSWSSTDVPLSSFRPASYDDRPCDFGIESDQLVSLIRADEHHTQLRSSLEPWKTPYMQPCMASSSPSPSLLPAPSSYETYAVPEYDFSEYIHDTACDSEEVEFEFTGIQFASSSSFAFVHPGATEVPVQSQQPQAMLGGHHDSVWNGQSIAYGY